MKNVNKTNFYSQDFYFQKVPFYKLNTNLLKFFVLSNITKLNNLKSNVINKYYNKQPLQNTIKIDKINKFKLKFKELFFFFI